MIGCVNRDFEQCKAQPVAYIGGVDEYGPMLNWYKHWANFPVGTKLYTSPPAQRRPLTEGEIEDLRNTHLYSVQGVIRGHIEFTRLIEAYYGIKENP